MKALIALLVVSLSVGLGLAAQVNPTSNVLGDTAKTASTLVYRNSSGEVDAALMLANETIITAHIKTSSVITSHTYLDLVSTRALCVKTNKVMGQCSSAVQADGTCTCS